MFSFLKNEDWGISQSLAWHVTANLKALKQVEVTQHGAALELSYWHASWQNEHSLKSR